MNLLYKLVSVASSIIVLVPFPAMAEWVPVSTTNIGTSFFIDTDSVSYEGNYVAFWQRAVPFAPGMGSTQTLEVTDCSTGNWMEQQKIVFAPTGQVIGHLKYKPNEAVVRPVTFGTATEEIYNFVCR